MSSAVRALAATLALFSAAANAACPPELSSRYTTTAELERADAVATVSVESAVSVPGPEGDIEDYTGGIFHVVTVDESLKGELPSRFVVFSARDSGRFDMEVDRQYLVFLSRDDMVWRVDACGNSGETRLRGPVLDDIRRARATP